MQNTKYKSLMNKLSKYLVKTESIFLIFPFVPSSNMAWHGAISDSVCIKNFVTSGTAPTIGAFI